MSDVESMAGAKQSSYKRTRGLAIKCEQLFRLFGGEVALTFLPTTNADIPFGYFSDPDHPLAVQMKREHPQSTVLVPDSFEYMTEDEADRRARSRDTPKKIRIKSTVSSRRRSPLKKAAGNYTGREPAATPTKETREGMRGLPPRPTRQQLARTSSTGDALASVPSRPERPRRTHLPPRPQRPNFRGQAAKSVTYK